jgi:hypothetical protein
MKAPVVTYILRGTPITHLHESKNRVAMYSSDVGCWELFVKNKKARSLPVSDWEFEWLVYSFSLREKEEGRVIKWVENG